MQTINMFAGRTGKQQINKSNQFNAESSLVIFNQNDKT